MNTKATTACAPGKALVAGGYLVLEHPNPGIVLAASDSRFYSTIQPKNNESPCQESAEEGWMKTNVDIYSPQFRRIFQYSLSVAKSVSESEKDAVVLSLAPRDPSNHVPNTFVERTLILTLVYVWKVMMDPVSKTSSSSWKILDRGIDIQLRADNDFYSHVQTLQRRDMDLAPRSISKLEKFAIPGSNNAGEKFNDAEEKIDIRKTGMGSSAALVTSLVGAILSYFDAISLPPPTANLDDDHYTKSLAVAHNLSQICHCVSQGKIGSGFDVSSAIYGSQIYRRFSPTGVGSVVSSIVNSFSTSSLEVHSNIADELFSCVNDTSFWDQSIQSFSLPPGLELMMADVCGGSESPGMARKVLKWKKERNQHENAEETNDDYWERLKEINTELVNLFTRTFAEDTHERMGLFRHAKALSEMSGLEWQAFEHNSTAAINKDPNDTKREKDSSLSAAAAALSKLRQSFVDARSALKSMGDAAGVPIEPDSQTQLADDTMTVPGVVVAGVPGAGGYDALFVIYVKAPGDDVENDVVRDRIGMLWKDQCSNEEKGIVCPLAVRSAQFGGSNGLRLSNVGW